MAYIDQEKIQTVSQPQLDDYGIIRRLNKRNQMRAMRLLQGKRVDFNSPTVKPVTVGEGLEQEVLNHPDFGKADIQDLVEKIVDEHLEQAMRNIEDIKSELIRRLTKR